MKTGAASRKNGRVHQYPHVSTDPKTEIVKGVKEN
jgi:hypothetical protein